MTILMVVLGALLWANIAGAAEVVDVALAANVSERQPVGAFTPAAACQTSTPPAYRVPVVDSQAFHGVYLWTKIAATQTREIHHRYYKESAGGFTVTTDIVLSVDPAEGYRTWSAKSILRSSMHKGMWKVDVIEVADAERVLCSIFFTVE
jgi:hypothetical protein